LSFSSSISKWKNRDQIEKLWKRVKSMTFVICGKLNIAPFVHERSGAHFANTPQLCNLIQKQEGITTNMAYHEPDEAGTWASLVYDKIK